jgi:hypothetical protein
MAKRFIDTELFQDPWFMDLSLSGKVMWMYCLTNCDHAGILKWNLKLIQFQTGIRNMDTVIKELGNRLLRVSEDYIFIPKFFEFQYPNYPDKKFRAADSAIDILTKFNLIDNTTHTVKQELTDSYSISKGNGNGNGNGNGTSKKGVQGEKQKKCLMKNSGITLNKIIDSFQKTNDIMMADPVYYFNTALAWSDSKGEMRVDWVATIANFARRDIKDGKLKIRKKSRIESEKPREDYGEISPTAVPMPESVKKRLANIGKEEKDIKE